MSQDELAYIHEQSAINKQWIKLFRKEKNIHSPLNNSVVQLATKTGLKKLFAIKKGALLGRSLKGKVKLAWDVQENTFVAIKIAVLQNEIEILIALGYFIASDVRLARMAKDTPRDKHIYAAIKYIPGNSLKNSKPQLLTLALTQRVHLVQSMYSELLRLNQLGVSHGDISEGNIMISPDFDKVTLVDFGQGLLWQKSSKEAISNIQEYDQYWLGRMTEVFIPEYKLHATIANVVEALKCKEKKVDLQECIEQLRPVPGLKMGI